MKKFKLISIFLLSFLFYTSNIFALSDMYSIGNRDSSNNYGVNKSKIEVTDSNKSNILNVPYVDASIKVYDYEDVLTDDEETKIRELIKQYTKETKMDFVLLIADLSMYSNDHYIETYAADFYDYNDFGIDDENYSGVIMIRDTGGRRDCIILIGDAQLYYDSYRLDDINNYIDYDIHNDNYYEMYVKLIDRSSYWYDLGIPDSMEDAYLDETGVIRYKFRAPIFGIIIGGGGVTLIVMYILIRKNRMVNAAKNANDYLDRKSIVYNVKNSQLVNSHTSSYRMSSSSSGGGGGSFHGSSGIGHSSGGVRHR